MLSERARRVLLAVAVLALVQAAGIGVYLAIEHRRNASVAAFPSEELSGNRLAPDIVLERADGTRLSLGDSAGRVRLVHFWATFCPPCVEELPGLLATSQTFTDQGLTVIAISMDEDWDTIRSFFGGNIPPEIYRAIDNTAHRRFDVAALPDSYLVAASGELLLRYGGARDWLSKAALAHLAERLR